MSSAVMLSIQPRWCELIASGEKTIEVRKSRPRIDPPFKCYIYCTKPKYEHEDFLVLDAGTEKARAFYAGGSVIGAFVCDAILPISIECSDPTALTTHYEVPGTGLSDVEIMEYLGNGVEGYGWHISDLMIYDTPKELREFSQIKTMRSNGGRMQEFRNPLQFPPQSWCYTEEIDNG